MSAKDRYQAVIHRVPEGVTLSSNNEARYEIYRGEPTTRLRAAKEVVQKLAHFTVRPLQNREVYALTQALRHGTEEGLATKGNPSIGDFAGNYYYGMVELV